MTNTQVIDAPAAEAPEVEVEETVELTPEAPEAPVAEESTEDVEDVEEAAPATFAPAPRTGNSAWASEEDRAKVKKIHDLLRAAGYTRPMINTATGFSDSATWRAQHEKVHTYELEAWLAYFKTLPRTEDGKEFLPAPGSKQAKPKVEDLQAQLAAQEEAYAARIAQVIEVLGDEAKTLPQLRKLVERAVEALTA
jgi:hypothetical protein